MEDLGPTAYFQPKNKFDKVKKIYFFKQVQLSKDIINKINKNHSDYYSEVYNHHNNVISTGNDYNKSKTPRAGTNDSDYNSLINLYSTDKKRYLRMVKKANSFSSNSNDSQKSKTFYNNPGPGTYEICHNFIKPSFGTTQTMQSKIERFQNVDNGIPGPGSYEQLQTFESCWNSVLKKFLEKKYNFNKTDLKKEERIRKLIEINKKLNEIPGAGTYNIDKKNSIVYKIYSRYNPKQCFESPFLNSSGRFIRFDNDDVSPVSYDPYKYENYNKNNQYKVLNKESRFSKDLNEIRRKAWLLAGPGSYEVEPMWNKKSFNVLFSSN